MAEATNAAPAQLVYATPFATTMEPDIGPTQDVLDHTDVRVARLRPRTLYHDPSAASAMSERTYEPSAASAMSERTREWSARLSAACDLGRLAGVEDALRSGANPDTHEVLHRAAAAGRADVVARLLDHGASVDLPDSDGVTALLEACGNGHLDVVCLLCEHGASVSRSDGVTHALKRACDNGHERVAQMLLSEFGASPHQMDDYGESVLVSAARMATCGFGAGCVRLLLDEHADVNAQTEDAETALSVALRCGLSDTLSVVKVLVGYGADAPLAPSIAADQEALDWISCCRGWAPLHHLEGISAERARRLLDLGADIHECASHDETLTPLRIALQLQATGLGGLGAPPGSAARVVLDASVTWHDAWSPASHQTFSAPVRKRVAGLVRLGSELGRLVAPGHEASFADAWLHHVVPRAVQRSGYAVPCTLGAAPQHGCHSLREHQPMVMKVKCWRVSSRTHDAPTRGLTTAVLRESTPRGVDLSGSRRRAAHRRALVHRYNLYTKSRRKTAAT